MPSIKPALRQFALCGLLPLGAPRLLPALAFLGTLPQPGPGLPRIALRPGLVISRSVRVIPRTYRFPAPTTPDSAVITIRGNDITVDFAGATLQGLDPATDPDQATGIAIRIDGGRNVRLRDARVRGYKIGILVRGTRDLELLDNDVSHNWKPRLLSLVEHESLVDWLTFHHNESDEWLRYGAGIYLAGVSGGTVRGNRGLKGMNGLLLTRSDHLRIEDNTFSFNSGLGIGLYRSSDNTIVRNRVEFDVRGYSHHFYRRGQDSAGLLLYEQSSRNVVAWNSVTHGGDGLFLWAGQSTMDTGQGGANDNLFYGNDFSYAPANAMEATFSRNNFVANRAAGSEYGLWGGYSFNSKVVGNCFIGNRTGIAIEHGQDNLIVSNRFLGDSIAIRLWADSIEPSDWGYPKHRDTRSRDYRVEGNTFAGNAGVLKATNTSELVMAGNDSLANAPATCTPPELPPEYSTLMPDLPGVPHEIPASLLAALDRSTIVVDEWGPFDWQSPKLWPVDSTRAVPLRLAVLGPAGRWRLLSRRGIATLSATAGRTGDTIAVTPALDAAGDWELTLEYRGGPTVSPSGARSPAGRPYRFSYGRFEPVTDWTIRFFGWGDSTDLRKGPEAFKKLAASTPLFTRHAARLDYEWYRPGIPELPREPFALEATTALTLPAGRYTLRAVSDDGIRVWVDGALVIDHWAPHESAVDSAALDSGRHELRVRYYQADGWTELRLEILRRR
jgi:parallel beta-helix repeat protein